MTRSAVPSSIHESEISRRGRATERHRPPRIAARLALTGAVLAAVVGCSTGTPAPEPSSASPRASASASVSPSPESPSPVVSPSASVSPSVSATPPPSATPTATATPPAPTPPPADDTPVQVTAGCLDLVSLDAMYAYNPNVGVDPAYAPAAGTLPASAVANGGVACGWLNQSSGNLIEIAAARPGAATLEKLEATASAGAAATASTYCCSQFFSTAGGIGTVQSFGQGIWVVVSSAEFTESADAQPLVDAATAALG